LCAGDAFLVAPLEAVAVGSFEAIPFGFVTLQIPAGLVSVESRSSHPNGRVFSRHDGTAMCQKLISRLILAGSGEAQQAAIDEAITLFLSRAGHSTVLAARRVREHPVVGRACSILDDALEFGLPLTALGAAVHLNHRYVISLFNNEIGLTPHQYFMSRRVDSARRMVNRGQPLNAVAAAAGYNDQSHFTREFKRAFGVTPGAYRSRHCHMDSLQSFPGVVA
jgi:AraC-like DNA-binding protein